MKNVYFTLLVFIYFQLSTSTLRCNPNDRCICIPSYQDFEFQCPSSSDNAERTIVHVKGDAEILIDCPEGLEEFHIDLLPNITLTKIDKFRMRFCPLPKSFKEVFDRFGLKEVRALQYGYFNLSDVKLSKGHFEGLEFLDCLQVNANGLEELEEDVFANTPKLTSLELQLNRIILTETMFQYTPNLKILDLSENRIETIPNGTFKDLNKLEILHLWHNDLQETTDDTFQGLTSLKSLELSLNKIETVGNGSFTSLVNLQKVNLSSNKFKALSSDTFTHNKNLRQVVIKNNPNVKLSQQLLANLPLAEEIDLSNCKLASLPESIFENSSQIRVMKLTNNKLTELPEKLFQGLRSLQELYLYSNQINRIGRVFSRLNNVKILHLQSNRLERIEKDDFRDLTDLEEINLRGNNIATIDNQAFQFNDKLKKIDLSKNLYAGEYNSQLILLENVPSVQSVDLSHNRIVQVGDVIALYNKVYLEVLDLSHNQIANISMIDLQPLARKLTINLEYNNITTVDFRLVDNITKDVKDAFSNNDESQSVIFLANNPLDCDCYNYDLVRYFQFDLRPQVKVMFDIKTEDVKCASPPELRDMDLETLPRRLLVCKFDRIDAENQCPEECDCHWKPYDTSLVLDCSNRNLTQFPQIELCQTVRVPYNQTELHLEGNNLSVGLDGNLTSYENVTKLYLSGNKIKSVEWLPPQLKELRLDNNKISRLDYQVLDMMNTSSLRNVTLSKNPWRCECEAENLTNFLRQHTKVNDVRYVRCFNSTNLLMDLNRKNLCHTINYAFIFIPILVVLLVVALLLILYYNFQEPIKIWLYANNLCLWWVTEEELDKDKKYDAFISYSHKDEDFVVQDLVPILEGGPTPYELCLHFRNFVPGEFISTQVTNSVLKSRRTLVVLSKNFLESVWGKMEFRTAHTQAMTEGRARVIIVLYGDIDIEKLDDELKAYMKTNTYVKWGDPYFWNKLRYALPHSKRNCLRNNQKIVNVMSCIDDKFKLVTPVTPSPGTTPPVLNLDCSILKRHPLNFMARSDMDTPPAESGLLVSTGL